MKRIGIYVCGNVAKKCTANGCLRAFNEKVDSFSDYDESDDKLVSFNNCIGCDDDPMGSLIQKIEKFNKASVDTIHLSSCIRGRCEYYGKFVDELAKYFDVIGYTHGTSEGKKNNNINKKRVASSEL